MECTQRLECTQDLCSNQREKICPEQVGYLGICGSKYPVKKGPNKIGRDPQTCNIVLNLNSISRQHAVINILNKKEFMLMDLDSANKTKIIDKTLQPYIPHPLKNGDTVQFGQVFGIFRLLEEDNDLPMTQAVDIPETPVGPKYMSRLNNGVVTTVPESPDVSDKDDSFIMTSQPKTNTQNKNANHFLKPSSTVISIQPVGSKKIDNVYWKSSKKSTSLSMQLDDSSNSLNDSTVTTKSTDKSVKQNKSCLFDMETQVPDIHNGKESIGLIYTADTQMPNDEVLSIHSRETQIPTLEIKQSMKSANLAIHALDTQVPDVPSPSSSKPNLSPNIHSLETQLPSSDNNVSPIDKQFIYGMETQVPENFNKEQDAFTNDEVNKDDSIFDAQTQIIPINCEFNNNESNKTGDDIILFDDINTQSFEEDFDLPSSLPTLNMNQQSKEKLVCTKNKQQQNQLERKLHETDDTNILTTQKITPKDDEDITDCEDDIFEDDLNPKICTESKNDDNHLKIAEIPTQVILAKDNDAKLQDMLTQVIEEDKDKLVENDPGFGDLLTQKIVETENDENSLSTLEKTRISTNTNKQASVIDNNDSPFKVPFLINKAKNCIRTSESPSKAKDENDERYYTATQDLFDDLCSQNPSLENHLLKTINVTKKSIAVNLNADDEFFTSSVNKMSGKINSVFQEENETSPKKKYNNVNESTDVVEIVKRFPSDPSDVEITPTKIKPIKFMDVDLPNSQEIKTTVSLRSKIEVTESSSDSETGQQNSEECTPFLLKRKKRVKQEAKIDLTKKFEIDSMPTRIITRKRKPTVKAQECSTKIRKMLQSKLIPDQEDNIDKDIITENISRLRNKLKHSKQDEGKKDVEVKLALSTQCKGQKLEINNEDDSMTKISENADVNNKQDTKKTRVKKEKKQAIISNKIPIDKEIQIEDIQSVPEGKIEHVESIETSKSVRTRRQKIDVQLNNATTKTTTKISDSKKEENLKKESKKDSQSHEMKTDSRRKRATKRIATLAIEVSSPEQEVEVRRSKRQRNVKDNKDKSTISNASVRREQSTVYGQSSESGNDNTPRNIKQSFTVDIEVSNSKRTRSVASSSNNSSLRSTPARLGKTQYVLFTAFPCEEVRCKLEKLGAVIVTDVTKCTVLLTLQVKRTFKLLCAVGLGVPIVGPSWVQACVDTNMLVDPWLYIIKDEAAEKRFSFSLEKTLVGKRNFLKGYNISATPSVLPTAAEMKLIIECSGGTWKGQKPDWVCVSCIADKPLWPALRRRGATIVSTEFILGGVLRQQVDLAANVFK